MWLRWPKNQISYSEQELAVVTIERVSTVVWGVLAVYQVSESLFGNNPVGVWQFVFAALCLAGWSFGNWKIREVGSAYAYLPLAAILLLAPFACQPFVNSPWTSYGLIAIAFGMYATDFPSWQLMVIGAVSGLTLQILSAELKITSITDRGDIALDLTLYSSIWFIVIFLIMVITRKRLFELAEEIDQTIYIMTNMQHARERKIRLTNIRDHLNVKLHGTVLNTLIVLRNQLERDADSMSTLAVLDKDLNSINVYKNSSALLIDRITNQFEYWTERRLKIRFEIPKEIMISADEEDQLIEIIREILNNTERHTLATNALVTVQSTSLGLRLEVQENSAEVSNESPKFLEQSAQSSVTMDRLVSAVEGTWSVTSSQSGLVHVVDLEFSETSSSPTEHIQTIRGQVFKLLARNFPRLSGAYGTLIIFPLVIMDRIGVALIPFVAALTAFWLSTLIKRFSFHFALLACFFGLSILPIFEITNFGCQDLRALPWIWNGLLGPIFLISTKLDARGDKFYKWLPFSGFLLESVLTVKFFPGECNKILQGSTPGLLIIGIAALLVGFGRSRAQVRDKLLRDSDSDLRDKFENVNEILQMEREEILARVFKLIHLIRADKAANREELILLLENHISFIRNFLLCSEHYHHEIIRLLYSEVKARSARGLETKVEILTRNIPSSLSDVKNLSYFSEIMRAVSGQPVGVRLFEGVPISLEIELPAETLALLQSMPLANSAAGPIHLSVQKSSLTPN